MVRKYRNEPTGGFASKREARRYDELRLLERAGEVRNIQRQVSYVLIPAQRDETGTLLERMCYYVADFVYEERNGLGRATPYAWHAVVEDAKGVETEVFKIKRKLMLFIHGIRVRVS